MVCNLQKIFIYTLTRFLNIIHNLQIWVAIQVQQYPSWDFISS